MKHLYFTLSCALVFVQLGCGSDDNASPPAGTGGTTATSTSQVGGNSSGEIGGNTSSSGGATAAGGTDATAGGTTAAAGSTGTTTLPQSPYSGKLAVNELVPSNHSGAIDEGGSYPDWLELYNMTAQDISLSGFYITDSLDEPTKGPLDASLTIKAGGVLLLWADGDVDQGVLHMPFGLAAGGEGLYLFDPEQKLVDSVEWGQANADASYSRLPDGTGSFAWCSSGTPNRTNGQACPN